MSSQAITTASYKPKMGALILQVLSYEVQHNTMELLRLYRWLDLCLSTYLYLRDEQAERSREATVRLAELNIVLLGRQVFLP
jgi:hypothetical protein